MSYRALTILNEQGDVTLIWEEADDAAVLPVIEKKMKEGTVFFLIEPRMGGFAPPAKRELRDVEAARQHRALSIRDEDFAAFASASKTAQVVKTPKTGAAAVRKAASAKEVAGGETVGVRPMAGG
jgi:hypothetical protein